MKKIIYYLSACLFLLGVATSCEDNENWRIIEDAQPGTYIVGSATIFSGEASTSTLKMVDLDGSETNKENIIGIYTWLKADGEFNISVVKEAGQEPTRYGKGATVEEKEDVITISEMDANASAFRVSKDGLYYVVVNTTLNQVSILPVNWGVIGAATAGGWDTETLFNAPTFDETSATAEWTVSTTLSAGEFKFRYSGGWGYEIPYDATSKVKLFTDVTGTKEGSDNILTEGYTDLQTGGSNLVTNIGGEYSIYMKYDIRGGKFSARYVLTGEPVIPPTYPEKLFLVGDAFNGWEPSTDAKEFVPVNGTPSSFWKIAYLKEGAFKMTVKLGWGDDFGIAEENTDAIGEYTKGGNNINVKTPGHYLIYINLEEGVISVTEANVYLFGDTNGGDWEYKDENKFKAEGTTLVSPAFVKDGNLRMAIKHPLLSDWWKAEFNVFDGTIEFRGNGGDQATVTVNSGQKVSLDFNAGTGKIE